MQRDNGFVLLILLPVLSLILFSSIAIMELGCGDILKVATHNDYMSAYYASLSGAEVMYATLKSAEYEKKNPAFPVTVSGTVYVPGAGTISSYSATASVIEKDELFIIVSNGMANSRQATVTVKYAYKKTSSGAAPLVSIGPVLIRGHGEGWSPSGSVMPSYVYIQGPLSSASTITTNEYVVVTPSDSLNQNQPNLSPVSFWLDKQFDTNNDKEVLNDLNDDGVVTHDEALAQSKKNFDAKAVFNNDNINNDTVIDSKDAFIYYYTQYFTKAENNPLGRDLGLEPGGINHYDGFTYLGGWGIDGWEPYLSKTGERDNIILVDGILATNFAYIPVSVDADTITIVSTGDIWASNVGLGPQKNLVLIAYGNVYIENTWGPEYLANPPPLNGDLTVYAHGNFHSWLAINAHIAAFVEGSAGIDTLMAGEQPYNMTFSTATNDWSESPPLGIPPSYPTLSSGGFQFDNSVKPQWERS